jgi:hypothetical protein
MESIVFLLFVLGLSSIALVAALLVQFGKKAKGNLQLDYARLAEKYRGTAAPGGFARRPTLRFPHDGAEAVVDTVASTVEDSDTFLQFHIAWCDSNFARDRERLTRLRMDIRPEGISGTVANMLGVRDFAVGDRKFDNRYRITGNDEATIMRMLTPSARERIDELWKIYFNDSVNVSIHAGRFRVRKIGPFRNFGRIDRFVSLSLALFDEMQAASRGSAGVEWVPPLRAGEMSVGESKLSVEWLCQVCGEGPATDGSAGEIVVCRRCKSPHHKDCWTYNGACSTYGCGETQSMVAGMVHRLGAP